MPKEDALILQTLQYLQLIQIKLVELYHERLSLGVEIRFGKQTKKGFVTDLDNASFNSIKERLCQDYPEVEPKETYNVKLKKNIVVKDVLNKATEVQTIGKKQKDFIDFSPHLRIELFAEVISSSL